MRRCRLSARPLNTALLMITITLPGSEINFHCSPARDEIFPWFLSVPIGTQDFEFLRVLSRWMFSIGERNARGHGKIARDLDLVTKELSAMKHGLVYYATTCRLHSCRSARTVTQRTRFYPILGEYRCRVVLQHTRARVCTCKCIVDPVRDKENLYNSSNWFSTDALLIRLLSVR